MKRKGNKIVTGLKYLKRTKKGYIEDKILLLIFSPLLFLFSHPLALFLQFLLSLMVFCVTDIIVGQYAGRILFDSMDPARRVFLSEAQYYLVQKVYCLLPIILCGVYCLYMLLIEPVIHLCWNRFHQGDVVNDKKQDSKRIMCEQVKGEKALEKSTANERNVSTGKNKVADRSSDVFNETCKKAPNQRTVNQRTANVKTIEKGVVKKHSFEDTRGSNIIYTILTYLFIGVIGYLFINHSFEKYGYDDDFRNVMIDYHILLQEQSEFEIGVFSSTERPLAADGSYHVECEEGVIYLMYHGGNTDERKTLRVPKEYYQRQDWLGVYTCQVKYTPFTKVVYDIHPVPMPKADFKNTVWSSIIKKLNVPQQDFLSIMCSEQLSNIYINANHSSTSHEDRYTVHTDYPVTREQFESVLRLYFSMQFEYSVYRTVISSMPVI